MKTATMPIMGSIEQVAEIQALRVGDSITIYWNAEHPLAANGQEITSKNQIIAQTIVEGFTHDDRSVETIARAANRVFSLDTGAQLDIGAAFIRAGHPA